MLKEFFNDIAEKIKTYIKLYAQHQIPILQWLKYLRKNAVKLT